MKKITLLLVIIFTFLFTKTSWGEWTYVIKKDSSKYYYDKGRVRKSDKSIYFWELFDLKEQFQNSLSDTSYTQIECSIFRYKTLKFQSYKKSMGEGENKMDFTPKGKLWRVEISQTKYFRRNSI